MKVSLDDKMATDRKPHTKTGTFAIDTRFLLPRILYTHLRYAEPGGRNLEGKGGGEEVWGKGNVS